MKNYKINSVLHPTDFSESSQSAVKSAIAICKRQNSKLTLVHVIDKTNECTSKNIQQVKEEEIFEYFKQVEKELENMTNSISQQFHLEVWSIIEKGDPADVICKVADEGGFNLIVMGAHGFSGNNENLGTTTYNVVKNATCPVMSIRGDWNQQHFKKILYPIRMDQKVFEKFNYIEPIVEQNNAELIIAGLAYKDDHEDIEKTLFSVDLLRNMCQEENIPYSTIVLPSNSHAIKIVETANEVNADLIVISSHLAYDAKENFIEPFAQYIVNNSKCPVLSISPVL
jgi:nucleotide-binding universal stress UspA family protein